LSIIIHYQVGTDKNIVLTTYHTTRHRETNNVYDDVHFSTEDDALFASVDVDQLVAQRFERSGLQNTSLEAVAQQSKSTSDNHNNSRNTTAPTTSTSNAHNNSYNAAGGVTLTTEGKSFADPHNNPNSNGNTNYQMNATWTTSNAYNSGVSNTAYGDQYTTSHVPGSNSNYGNNNPSFRGQAKNDDSYAGSNTTRCQGAKEIGKENLRIFGHHSFRAGQKEVIEAAVAGRDVFVLMPTGGGKSLCYQLPAWCRPGLSVVISPLLSLIEDQVQSMKKLGVESVFLTSAQEFETQQRDIIQRLRQTTDHNSIKLLYITPEKIRASAMMQGILRDLVSKNLINRFVIDEAHCLR
jgi:hypothetical protein